MPRRRCLLLLASLLWLAGCGGLMTSDVQRASEGPTADEVYRARFVRGYARVPTFDEEAAFRAELDRRLNDYLRRHPELATSPRLSQFRFHRRVAVGMTREEVLLLLGPADAATTDRKAMEAIAKPFWPAIRDRAGEMWAYPGGWQLYLDGDRLADITVVGKEPL